jgi:hypothetical protein
MEGAAGQVVTLGLGGQEVVRLEPAPGEVVGLEAGPEGQLVSLGPGLTLAPGTVLTLEPGGQLMQVMRGESL